MDADWVICLATIKFRNPSLWDALQRSIEPHKPDVTRSDPPEPEDVFGLINEKLSHLKLNRPLLRQLDTVYHYLLDGSLRGNIDIIRTFVDDIPGTDVLRWYWPNYKLVATVLCLGHHDGCTRRLFQCFQLLIVSFACFHRDKTSFVTETMIVRFVRSDMLAVKERQTKCIAQFVSPGADFNTSFELTRMCKLHFNTVNSVLNLQSQLKNSTAISLAFDKICLVLESLVHVLLAHASTAVGRTSASKPSFPNYAFKERYVRHNRNMSHKYTKELLAALNRRPGTAGEKTRCLRIVFKGLLTLVDRVQWIDHERPKDAIRYRLNLQCTLLVAGDLDLISRFRLVRWPRWSIS